MPRSDGKTDLVVELRRRRNIAFLLDMKSHAGGTGLNAATIRSELLGDNWGCVLCSYGKLYCFGLLMVLPENTVFLTKTRGLSK